MSVQTAQAAGCRHKFTAEDREQARQVREEKRAIAAAKRAQEDLERRAWIREDARLWAALKAARAYGTTSEVLNLEQEIAEHSAKMTRSVRLRGGR